MLDREDALHMIGQAYAARARGDKEALAAYWSEGAHFRIAANEVTLHNITIESDNVMKTIGELIDRFTFTDLQRLEAVVEDHKVAIRWAVNVSFQGQPPVRTEMMDLIHLDDDGRILSFVQFADTALIKAMVEGYTET